MRVLFDTNVLISFALKPTSIPATAVVGGFLKHQVVTSRQLLADLQAKLIRPKFSAYVSPHEIAELVESIELGSMLATPTESIHACRDPDDNHVLETAVADGVAVIVTGDADLLVLKPFRGISIVNPATFLTLL